MKSNKRILPILLIIFTNILGAGVIIPILPLYAQGEFRGTVLQITLLASAFFGAQFLAAPWLGKLSDRYGRRPLLLISQVGTLLSFLLFIFAGDLCRVIDGFGLQLTLSGGMIMLFVARILDGTTGGNITIAQAYISDVSSDEERAQSLGMLQAAFGAGFIFGPALGGFLSNFGLVAPFVGATIITTLTFLLTLFTLEESLPEEERAGRAEIADSKRSLAWSEIISARALMLILVIAFIASLAFSALPATFALFADGILFADFPNPERVQFLIGLMLAFSGLMQVLTQILWIRPLVRRFGERRLFAFGQFSIAVSLFGIGISGGPLLATLFLAPFAFGFGVGEPSTQALVTRFGSRNLRGYLLGLYQSARSLALIAGPIAAGFIYENVQPRAVYFAGAALLMLAFFSALRLQGMQVEEIA